ncbi:DUF6470 family protein [Sporomusa malonica]|uniref:Uncharacterized protein n=1 Tax=Sporomusa malonica TaxID=112901 RepID=A0A1W1YVI2_9FIRM|nr:DUF6470 family protein [Sporomusa malonica]SMC39841.1 hypothetical protein SAMN04488500_102215 [Sporomusa malonica]
MLRLNISQQYAKIDITTERPFLGMKTTASKLDIQTEPATVEIRQPQGELEIDNRPFRASYGIKDHGEFLRDCAELGKQTALETIGRIAQEGDRLAAIETQENAIANIAAESSYPPAPEITWAHLEKPIIHYTAHPVEFTPIEGHVTINVEPGTLDMDYRPGTVNIRMAQYQSIKMWTTGSAVDMSA